MIKNASEIDYVINGCKYLVTQGLITRADIAKLFSSYGFPCEIQEKPPEAIRPKQPLP